MDIYKLEVKKLLEEGGNERLKSQFMNLSRRLDEVSIENKELKKRISELESENRESKEKIHGLRVELAEKDAWLKIRGGLNTEPLPFSSDEYEECLEEELEVLRERHQRDFITINQLHATIDTLVDRYAKLREMRGM